MAYSELPSGQQSTSRSVSTSGFFDKLNKKVAKKVYVLSLNKAESMQYTLTHRMNLGKDWGRFPKWQPETGESPKESNRSYAGWRLERKSAGVYSLRNDVTNNSAGAWQGYSYVRNLITGTGWSDRAISGIGNRLTRTGVGVYSTQMPKGLRPWVRFKREELKNEIKREVAKL
jgi:hypothetical protein